MTYTKEQAKKSIQKLTERYSELDEKSLKRYSEEGTKKDFIEPFFEALGWTIRNQEEVTAEDRASKGHVDYGFRLNGILKFVVEAKPLRTELNKKEYVEQAIDYAWHKGVSWAILTDFVTLRIINADWKFPNPEQNVCLTLHHDQFLDRFEDLWRLSKESITSGKLDEWGETYGRRPQKQSVGEEILVNLMTWRTLLTKNIVKQKENQGLFSSEEEVDETVQRIIDRLVFIRTCEDRDYEDRQLLEAVREYQRDNRKGLRKQLLTIFTSFNDDYDSKLFQQHLCDKVSIDDDILKEVLESLYRSKDQSLRYDFSLIDADVLGSIYENYLGHILKKTEKRAKITEKHAHRKEMGIYYTPTYIVDYIVRNTLGELLKDRKPEDIKKIKVLDPACGSGSFLIKAVDVIEEAYEKSGKHVPFSRKKEILLDNIYGVDLDPKAAEIAQLNLLLKTVEKKSLLPLLEKNIQVGNSLIDDPAVVGDKAFKWDERFEEIMNTGGFNVVVGNPPYDVIYSSNQSKEWKYFKEVYPSAEYNPNLFALFIEKSVALLRNKGYLGFIIPDTLLTNKYFRELRKIIMNNCSIIKIIDLRSGIFADAVVDTIIMILQKKTLANHKIKVKTISNIEELKYENGEFNEISQSEFLMSHNNEFNIYFSTKITEIKNKMNLESVQLGDISNIKRGLVTKDNSRFLFKKSEVSSCKDPSKLKKIIIGKDATRYFLKYSGHLVFFDKAAKGGGCWDSSIYEADEKILIALISGGMKYRINATYDDQKYYALQNYNNLVLTETKFDIKYVLGLLNSRLINDYYGLFFKDKNVKRVQLQQIPIKQASESQQRTLIELVDKMLSLNRRLNALGDKQTDERTRLEEEIKRTDGEIDDLVYKIYGITEKEKKIIEGSLAK